MADTLKPPKKRVRDRTCVPALALLALCLVVSQPFRAGAQDAARETGLFYYAIENLDRNAIEQRGIAGSNGVAFDNLNLAPNTRYRVWLLQATTLRIGRVEIRTGPAGSTISIPDIVLREVPDRDADADGLSNTAERIMGTGVDNPDSDDDGILDGPEVRQGTDPLDGLTVRTGIIASVGLPDQALDLCVLNDLLVVAHRSGVTGLNVFTGLNPQVVMRINDVTDAVRVACSNRRIAVVDRARGLLVIDASDPPAARVVHEIPIRGTAQAVAAAADVAYVGDSFEGVTSIDMISGAVLGRVELRTGDPRPVHDLAIEGDTLYVLHGFGTLSAIRLDPFDLTVVGAASVQSLGSFRRLFVGGGIGYAVHQFGYSTLDLSNPSPVVIHDGSNFQLANWKDIAVNGSGLGMVAVGPTENLATQQDVSLYDVRDPTLTNELITTFATPGAALAVEIANGLAYVADNERGVQVINYLGADTQGVPPTITLEPGFDPDATEEGKRVFVRANVQDDVQVRSVEFVVDGVTSNDPSFPFEHQFVTPRIEDQPRFTLRARVFDTGGNFTWTDELIVLLSVDSTPPRLLQTSPLDDTTITPIQGVAAFFNEPLDAETVTAGSFTLIEAGPDFVLATADDVAVTGEAAFRDEVLGAFLSFPEPLNTGIYQARVRSTISDRAGNKLAADESWTFLVYAPGAADSDEDGIPDALEIFLGLDPNAVDSDGDGVNDRDEDSDGDGVPNWVEIVLGWNLKSRDTDGDGIPDGDEDSDGDGLLDVEEVLRGTDVFLTDTDGDGFSDSVEVANGSDPLRPSSTPLRTAVTVFTLRNLGPVPIDTAITVFTLKNLGPVPIDTAITVFTLKNDAVP